MFLQQKKHPPFNKTTSLLVQKTQMLAAFFGTPFKNHKYARREKNVQRVNRQVV
jgi:hypothetical protein